MKEDKDEDQKRNNSLGTVIKDLNYCLDVLKMKIEESESRSKLNELFVQNVTAADAVDIYGKRIVALKIIADLYTMSKTMHVFSQSELYDFLTLATEGILEHKRPTANVIVFKIYRDIMEDYETPNDSLKLNYPKIIIDVIAILAIGVDTSGRKVGLNAVEQYYKSRKSKPSESILAATAIKIRPTASTSAVARSNSIPSEPLHEVQKEELLLVETLAQITGRKSKELEHSLAKLNDSDIKKISNLCFNHTKIEKYCKLIATPKDFRNQIQKELGRKLTDNQLQVAALSIRKVRTYIENLLDGKFITHDSHGINHVKHNLEYGYQVIGLIESTRRRRTTSRSSTKR